MFIELQRDVYVQKDAICRITFSRTDGSKGCVYPLYAVVDWACGETMHSTKVEPPYLETLWDIASPRVGIGRLMPMSEDREPIGP